MFALCSSIHKSKKHADVSMLFAVCVHALAHTVRATRGIARGKMSGTRLKGPERPHQRTAPKKGEPDPLTGEQKDTPPLFTDKPIMEGKLPVSLLHTSSLF